MRRVSILGATFDQVREHARRHVGRGSGEAAAVYRHAFATGALAPEACNLGPAAAHRWHDAFDIALPDVAHTDVAHTDVAAAGDVAKAALRFADGRSVECVRIPLGRGRESLCLSSQVGCARACAFCETARMGLVRQLTADEIVAQLVVARTQLAWRPSTVVFMGMGEPLDNVDAVADAIDVFVDRRGPALRHDAITVCTVGHVPGLDTLRARAPRRLNVALSLNAADDTLRAEIMPVAHRWPLAEVQAALQRFRRRSNQVLGIHYCLLPGINDTRADARAVAAFCEPLGRAWVHLIPYNPGTEPLTRAPREHEVTRFIAWLRENGLAVRRRITKGDDVMAACGQLRTAR